MQAVSCEVYWRQVSDHAGALAVSLEDAPLYPAKALHAIQELLKWLLGTRRKWMRPVHVLSK